MASNEEHPHQHPHEQEQIKTQKVCWCNGASNIGEVKWVQDFMALLKPSIGEEVEKTINRVLLPYLPLLQKSVLPSNSSLSLHQAESSASRSLELKFKGDIPDTLFTLDKIEDEGASLEVELLASGKRVEIGPESSVKIKIDVLDGDFDDEGRDDLTEEDYTKTIARPRKDKGSLLKGKCEIVMSRGVASVSHIAITDISKTRNGTFRLGAKVVKGLPSGVVVKTAISKEFTVKERRLKNDRKHRFPSAEDDLWRLVHIRNHGQIYQRAVDAGIHTVKDFLQYCHTFPNELQRILRLSEKKWNEIVNNAEACKLTDKLYRYYDDASGDVLLLDCAFNIRSAIFMGQNIQQYKDLDEFKKKQADKLRCIAYKKRSELAMIDDPATHISVQALLPYQAGVQQAEGGQQRPPSGMAPYLGGLSGNLDAGDFTTNQMCRIPPLSNQGPTLSFLLREDVDQLDALLADTDLEMWGNLLDSTPPREERSNVSEVSARNHVTSKLIAVCYVTKAAALFMISGHQDPTVPTKKRKLQ